MVWLPFDLHPEYPPEGIARAELEARHGGRSFSEGLVATFREAGLPAADEIDHVPNSRKALRLGELARAHDRLDALHPRLFVAYWGDGRDIGDDDVLVEIATDAGLDEAEVRDVLASDRYGDFVAQATSKATDIGTGGVPAWVLDGRMLIPGAQPHEVFERALERFGHAPLSGDAVA
jgi:predicted DsbA family dithiol-disulfide isomerase